jgi:hypothetical protein
MIENRWDRHRWARDIPTEVSKNLFWKSPHTGSWMLTPINMTTEFIETGNWEDLKFRLSQVTYNPDWWTECPELWNVDQQFQDYYFSNVVTATNYSSTGYSLQGLVDNPIGLFPTLADLKLQQSNGVPVIISQETMQPNQGFTLRFRVEGRGSYQRGAFFDFWFGQFVMRVNTDGSAQVFQANTLGPGPNYAYVYQFQWAETSQVHDRWHIIHILPHSRNKIEFLALTTGFVTHPNQYSFIPTGNRGTKGGGFWQLPGDVSTRAVNPGTINQTYTITEANPWALQVSTEFRHHIQVSLIGFNNGQLLTANAAYLFDTILDPGFNCTVPVTFGADFDLPVGCGFQMGLIDPTKSSYTPGHLPTYANWTPPAQSLQYWISFQGAGYVTNYGGGIPGCYLSPEFYQYALSKPMKFYQETITPASFTSVDTLLTVTMNNGETAEQEHMSVTLLNNSGQVDAFCNQGSINVEMTDTPTGNLLFEGVGFGQTVTESPSVEASILTLPVVGMADRLSRSKWGIQTPNFEVDPNDPNQGWLFTDLINACFNQAGFDNPEVIIEDREYYFDPSGTNINGTRVWTGTDSGGFAAAKNAAGGGHETDAQPLGRFQPVPMQPVVDFLDWFLKDMIGWHYERGADRCWHVYKRPDPTSASDVKLGKFLPKVAFYNTQTAADAANSQMGHIPSYAMLHPQLGPIHRPRCAGIGYDVVVNPPPSSALIQQLVNEGMASGTTSSDPGIANKPVVHHGAAINPACYENNYNTPPKTNSVDYIGEPIIEEVLSAEGLNQIATKWAVRRLYQDNCRGWTPFDFEAPWGDVNTYNLRKYDVVSVQMQVHDGAAKPHYQMVLCTIANISPAWSSATGKQSGSTRRMAQYECVVLRYDGPPPR